MDSKGTNYSKDNIADDGVLYDDPDLKIILLGDSAAGKSKLIERYLMNEYNPRQLSTYALTMYRKEIKEDDGTTTVIDFWDTAGQEAFNKMHPSYYYRAHCCIMVFDVTRKITYQHLTDWYTELRDHCPNIPCVVVANKIDVDYNVTKKEFKFASKNNLPFFFVSAADGTNIVKVFNSAIHEAKSYKAKGGDMLSDVLDLLSGKDSFAAGSKPTTSNKQNGNKDDKVDSKSTHK